MTNDIGQYKVVKKLAPSRHGALKMAQRYGPKLVCVRHRVDPTGTTRIMTVELIVEQSPIRRRNETMVHVRIGFLDRNSRAAAMGAGAIWDPEAKLWRMTLGTAQALGLRECIVEER